MRAAAVVLSVLLVAPGCGLTRVERHAVEPGPERPAADDAALAPGDDALALQAHALDGDVVVFQDWAFTDSTVAGLGARYDAYRRAKGSGPIALPLDSVAVFVADREVPQTRLIAGLTILTGVSAALTVYCLTVDKACFGSCPTFYAPDADGTDRLVAEGYSASVAPSLEARDVDAIAPAAVPDDVLTLRMTNEALETHVTRRADVLLVPRRTDERVYFEGHGADDGTFWTGTPGAGPTACRGPEGDCLGPLTEADGAERASRADSTDLGARETLDLTFDRPEGERLALVVTARQSLLTTFLIYQGLAYAGEDVGGWVALGERRARGGETLRSGAIATVTDVPVEVEVDGAWVSAGVVGEVGPLARDAHLVRLPALGAGPVRVRLRPVRGSWRLDAVRLVALSGEAEPVRVGPAWAERETPGGPPADAPEVVADLADPDRQLVTLPGTALRLHYPVPAGAEAWEPFLETQGYYLEWMRDEWMAERDPDALAELLFQPDRALRRLAPHFAAIEDQMEAAFWGSRFAAPAAPPVALP